MIKEMITEDLPTHIDHQMSATEVGGRLEDSINNGPILTGQVPPNRLPGYPVYGPYVPGDQLITYMEPIPLQDSSFRTTLSRGLIYYKDISK